MRYGALKLCTVLALAASASVAQEATEKIIVQPLFETVLPDLPDREGLMATVDLPPSAEMPAHRHNANTFVYVLSGSVEMQVEGSDMVELTEGGTFYEAPDDVHSVARNASDSEPARLLVFFVKHKGAEVTEYVD
ncbi:cupin domain-containing protein [Pontibaca methylaminivorans]|uniref:cupin domain-containing protein n=1 Tax=Pontibaca methylaminivorans TaxID=515897 RepID=UPI002FDAFCDD